jgi:signal peptidase II
MTDAARRVLARLALFGVPCVFGSGCDLGTKVWVERTVGALPDQSLRVVDPWIEIVLAYNRGTAFSLVPDLGVARIVLGVVGIAVVLFLLATAIRSRRVGRAEIVGMGLVAGGALGNAIDRLFREAPGGGTGVVDFVRVHYPWGGSWPDFNVADALIAIGIAVIVLGGIAARKRGAASDVPPA